LAAIIRNILSKEGVIFRIFLDVTRGHRPDKPALPFAAYIDWPTETSANRKPSDTLPLLGPSHFDW
jgi:hypothetical protein